MKFGELVLDGVGRGGRRGGLVAIRDGIRVRRGRLLHHGVLVRRVTREPSLAWGCVRGFDGERLGMKGMTMGGKSSSRHM